MELPRSHGRSADHTHLRLIVEGTEKLLIIGRRKCIGSRQRDFFLDRK